MVSPTKPIRRYHTAAPCPFTRALELCRLLLLFLPCLALAEAEGRPNLVFLLSDDQRYDDLGCHGNPVIETPHLDALAQRGVSFRHCFVTSAVCMASRATCFTGRVERSHACNFYYRDLAAADWARGYPVRLREAGYRTGFFGKFGVKVEGKPKGLPENDFDTFGGFPGQGSSFPEGRDGPHLSRLLGDETIAFLEGAKTDDRPFCVSVSFKAPHISSEPDPRFDERYRDATPPEFGPIPNTSLFGLPPSYAEASWYPRLIWQQWFSEEEKRREFIRERYRKLAGVDAAVGRILAALEHLGLEDNTVVFFTSDHGYYYGEHGLATKFFLHEESIRVPLLVVGPVVPEASRGTEVEALASSIDLAPTLLDLAGVERPAVMQGRSLVPLLQGETPTGWRDAIFCENIIKERRPMCDAIRTHEWKYIAHFESDPLQEELYDLVNDPHEQTNLASNPVYAETKEGLARRLQARRVALSGTESGFPEWISTQKENAANWRGYRDRYLKLVPKP